MDAARLETAIMLSQRVLVCLIQYILRHSWMRLLMEDGAGLSYGGCGARIIISR